MWGELSVSRALLLATTLAAAGAVKVVIEPLPKAKEAKDKWKRLRNSHKEALRRRRLSNGALAQPWLFGKQMEFLLDRNTIEVNCSTCEVNNDGLDDEEQTTISPKCGTSTIDKSEVCEPPKAKRQKITSVNNQETSLKSFFDSMYQKTSSLPGYLLIRVQREIFDSVLKAEEQSLTQHTVHQFSPSNSDTCVSDEEPIEIKYSIQESFRIIP